MSLEDAPAATGSDEGDGEESEEEELTEEDLASIITDSTSALAQMQATVNEVLDFRAIESGMNSLKLNKEPVVLEPVYARRIAFAAAALLKVLFLLASPSTCLVVRAFRPDAVSSISTIWCRAQSCDCGRGLGGPRRQSKASPNHHQRLEVTVLGK